MPEWPRIAGAVKQAAIATGRGTAWLARAAHANRNYVPAVINGAIGDKLARGLDPLAIRMSFREARADVAVAAAAAKLPAGAHVTVFVHGLMGDEVWWQTPAGREGLGPMLAREASVTPLYVRYNSGLHISQNGRALAALLDELSARADIARLTLIGHSMGGLVVRSAGHYATLGAQRWLGKLGTIVLLGPPNDGSYVEQLSHFASFVLRTIPNLHTRIISRVIDERSDGIKDLRHGLLVDDDWQPGVPEGQRTQVPPLSGVRHHVLVGTLAGDPDSLLAAYFGDGMVGRASASATEATVRVIARTSHLGLMTHPEAHADILAALRA